MESQGSNGVNLPEHAAAGELVDFASRLLRREGGSMGTILFYNTLAEAGYHRVDAEAVLRDYSQFVVTTYSVALHEEEA